MPNKKNREVRSEWVAVEPEFASSSTSSTNKNDNNASSEPVRAAATAYQFFQRENTSKIQAELASSGQAADVGSLTKAVSLRWQNLDNVRRARYDEMAQDDKMRFLQESHVRDVEMMKRQERLRRERDEIIVAEDGGRSTRSGRRKEIKKHARIERRQQKKQQKKRKVVRGSDDDSDYVSSGQEEEDEEKGSDDSDYESESSYSGDSSESDESSFDSDDSSRPRKPNKKKKQPKKKAQPKRQVQLSSAALAARERARAEKEEKEQYIAGRQADLRKDRAKQAKRRLDFLLKQSDIFSHFGNVKEDSEKYLANRRTTRSSTTANNNNNNNNASGGKNEGIAISRHNSSSAAATSSENDAKELEEADDHEATFLTAQPSTLGFGKMRAYQLEGLNWMIRLQEHGVNGILADEMGLGKTLQSISILVYMMESQQSNGPHLVVVPKSTLSNWMAEFERWAPTLTVVRFHGTKDEREVLAKETLQPGQRDEHRSWHVVVTTYEVCNLDRQVLNKFAWSYLVIDEAHRLKNEASAFSITIRSFETRFRLLLTGTPLQNNLHELWALLNFLVPDVFASAEQFDEWFNLDIDDADEKNKLISQLHKILRPFMLRRLKADVETSLPPKHETILFTGMSAMQKKLYKDILMRDVEMLQGKNASGSRTAILNIVMQLRKCAGHPYLFPGVEDRSLPPLGEHLVENCGKLVVLDKLLTRLQERGHRVLLFTQMTRILDILEDYMVMRKFKYCRIDGNTSYELREESIDAYNAPNSEKFLFLLSTRAGGLGINLQTADVVILYDSDWNPQADLQAQDRAHRIGQKKEVQVFRLVTEHTVEEKIVERAQQKLKLDAMVVQQGRLKDKDKLSRDELLEAVRFGADKVFKSKDSSITDDDIDMILDVSKKKTQELNEKLQNADKGDMLDFKLDGGGYSAQTFEGVDYSQQSRDFAEAKEAQAQAELLSIMDMGKRERKTVANYNENQLYQQQIAALQGPTKSRRKKELRLPKFLRLPRLDEWQMFDRDSLNAIQEEEEQAFQALPPEVQKMSTVKGMATAAAAESAPSAEEGGQADAGTENAGDAAPASAEGADASAEGTDAPVEGADAPAASKSSIDMEKLPPLLSKEQEEEKKRLLSEGFADWNRSHYSLFVKASARFGRTNFAKIAPEVGKSESAIEDYAQAFWDNDIGRKRFSEHEYDRVVKIIERGEKKLKEIKGLERGTKVLLSLFDNPWVELEFTHVNVKDKMFTMEEDRYLLCWTHKFGYGQWGAVKMAIRRSHQFRFDYFLRSLPIDALGRRCEQLMKAAEREVEHLEKQAREEMGTNTEEEKKDETLRTGDNINEPTSAQNDLDLPPIRLPMFKEVQANKRAKAERELEEKRQQLEKNVEDIEDQMEVIQNRLKVLQEYSKEGYSSTMAQSSEVPDELLPELANLVAKSGPAGILTVTNEFVSKHPGLVKRQVCAKIEEIAKKEKREEEGDTRMVWYLLPDYMHLLDVDTLRYLRKSKEERLRSEEDRRRGGGRRKHGHEEHDHAHKHGAEGPDGDIVPFPEYDGSEPPRENKKAFTLFCNATRKEVKSTLSSRDRKDKSRVNSILKDKWFSLTKEEKSTWKKWEKWDAQRHDHDVEIFEKRKRRNARKREGSTSPVHGTVVPKKRKSHDSTTEPPEDGAHGSPKGSFSIPKKRRSG